MPSAELLPDRLEAALAVLYLIFTEGYEGRGELAAEAIRLGTALAELMPDESEVHGLLALMLLNDSRREARTRDGELVLLADQDRSLWDRRQIEAGRAVLTRAFALGGRGPYLLQAAIARLHVAEGSDWKGIALLYAELAELTGSPVVQLNRAVALAESEGARGQGSKRSRALSSRTISICTRPAPSCCGGSVAARRRAPPMAVRWNSFAPSRSAGSWSAASPSCRCAQASCSPAEAIVRRCSPTPVMLSRRWT